MGDRVSISFKDNMSMDSSESPSIFHHWGGTKFPKTAMQFVKDLKKTIKRMKSKGSDPLTRLESRNVVTQFFLYMNEFEDMKYTTKIISDEKNPFEIKEVEKHPMLFCYSLYMCKDKHDRDNSDNVHYTIYLQEEKMKNEKGEFIS